MFGPRNYSSTVFSCSLQEHRGLLIYWALSALMSSALPCLLCLVTAFNAILLMQLFLSMRASPKENWSMTLDVNLSSACDTVLTLQNDLWADSVLVWGILQRTDLSTESLHNCLENFWWWGWEIPPGWTASPPDINFLVWAAHLGLVPKLQTQFSLSLVLLTHSLSPFKKGIRKTGVLFRKYQLWSFPSLWANGRTMKQWRKTPNGTFPDWCFLEHSNKYSF